MDPGSNSHGGCCVSLVGLGHGSSCFDSSLAKKVSYPSLLIHYLRNLMIAWSRNDCPKGVSIFFTPSFMPDVGTFQSDLSANLEASQGAGFLLRQFKLRPDK